MALGRQEQDRSSIDWQCAKEIFGDALELSTPQRAVLLDRRCGKDSPLRRTVEDLLRAHSASSSLFVESTPRPDAVRATAPPPEQIGPYRVSELLGEGGFGRVYRATQAAPFEREVAIKLLKPGLDSARVLRRFQAERDLLAKLDHPGIARILDAGATADGQPYVALELVVGGTGIVAYCNREALPIRARVALLRDACRAIHHAHQRAILHRDLKPSNILVSTADGAPVIRIIDFGIAKALDNATDPNWTRGAEVLGTPRYMAPEQRDPGGAPDVRTDVFALGVVLCELLCGQPPRDMRAGSSESAARRPSVLLYDKANCRNGGKRPEGWNAIRGDLDRIVVKCVEWEPENRYDSTAAVADDLDRYLRNEPVVATKPTSAYRLQKFVRRHAIASVLGCVALVALFLGGAGLIVGLQQALEERDRTQAAREEADREARRAAFVNRFLLEDMLRAVDPDVSGGRNVTVHEVLDEAARRLAERIDLDLETQYRTLLLIGNGYRKLGSYEAARAAFERAHELAEQIFGAPSRETIRLRLVEFDMLAAIGRESSTLAAQLSADGEALLDEKDPLWRSIRQRVSADVDELKMIVGSYAQEADPDPDEHWAAWWHLAHAYMHAHDHGNAVDAYRRLYEHALARYGPEHSLTLGMLGMHATLRARRLHDTETLDLLRRAYERSRARLGVEHPNVRWLMRGYGEMLGYLGQHTESVAILEENLAVVQRTAGEDSVHYGTALAAFGQQLLRAGRAVEALPLLERARVMRARQWSTKHPCNVRANNDIARCRLLLGDPLQALRDAMTATELANRGEPLCAEAHLLRARALTQLGRLSEACAALSDAVNAVGAAEETGSWLAPWIRDELREACAEHRLTKLAERL